MKKTITPSATIFALLAFTFFFCSAFTNGKNGSNGDTKDVCLEISGKINFDRVPEDHNYKIELIHMNTVEETATVNHKSTFKFHLRKDTYYTIRISEEGYATKLVSINTHLGKDTNKGIFCKFHFTTNLLEEDKAAELDQETLDFPIALVTYDKTKKVFQNNEKYTSNIKKLLYTENEEQN